MTSRVNPPAELNVLKDTPEFLHKSRMNAGTFGTIKRAIISPKPFLLDVRFHKVSESGGIQPGDGCASLIH